jgi:hypothetical protein
MRFEPADVHAQEGWEDVERCLSLLEWYENAPKARERVTALRAWMGGSR